MKGIIKCGSKVRTALSNINGIVTAVSIRFNSVSYEVSYFNNGEYKQAWLNKEEFIIIEGKPISIGFIN